MQGKIIFNGISRKNTSFYIRYPKIGDSTLMQDYINTISEEQTFIRFQGEKVTLEHETKFLNDQLEKISKNQAVLFLVFSDQKLIGISGIEMKDRTSKHEGVFGISVAKEFRCQGIGKILMHKVLDEAVEDIPQLKIITLGIFANNPAAFKMYENFGFKEFGRLPEGILHKGKYVDHVYMYKKVR
ncbi:GNAT family N-acetyltransferase [Candidatus Gottesmanbacteria bacterium]|nr:GNAT family N-acetyltransferase [Candidatus Gottesmanbacteria bacterium]